MGWFCYRSRIHIIKISTAPDLAKLSRRIRLRLRIWQNCPGGSGSDKIVLIRPLRLHIRIRNPDTKTASFPIIKACPIRAPFLFPEFHTPSTAKFILDWTTFDAWNYNFFTECELDAAVINGNWHELTKLRFLLKYKSTH